MTKRISRRDFLKTVAFGSAATVLAACGSTPSTTTSGDTATTSAAPASSEPVSLTYWHSWTEQWEEMTKAVCENFTKANTGVTASETVVPGTELITKLLSAVAAGNPPDMITIYSSMGIPSLVEQNALIEMSDEKDLAEAKDWFYAPILEMGTYKSKVYGLSYWQQTPCLGWNKDAFSEVGLDPNTPPTTIDELDAMAQKLFKDDGTNITRMGLRPYYYWLWAAAWGGSFYDEQNRKVTADNEKIVEMFTWMASYSKKYDVTKLQAFEQGLANERAGTLDPFLNGQLAMDEVGGAWKLGDYKKYAGEKGFNFGIVPVPNPTGMTGKATYSYGDFTVVPKGTKHPQEAWKFVKFTGGLGGSLDDYYKTLTWGDRPINVPVTTKMLDYEPFKKIMADYPGFQEMVDLFLKGDRVMLPPKMPVGQFYSDRLDSARDKIRLLEGEPAETLKGVSDEVQKELDNFYANLKS
jgi:multiple sugar transport system substrate-binding protein